MLKRTVIPYVYFISGLGFLSYFGSELSFLLGSLLVLVACLMWLRRLEHRHNKLSDSTTQS